MTATLHDPLAYTSVVAGPDLPDAAWWEFTLHQLLCRSGGRCEARTPACTAPAGTVLGMPRDRISLHHRRPRGMGGTDAPDVHSLTNLLLVCGSGTTGCHGYIEANRTWSYARGLLVPHPADWAAPTAATDPARVPVTLPSGRRVLLDPAGVYLVAA